MNPQALNPLTIGNYPRKIDEYLAMGKPAIATSTEAMHMFLDYVFVQNKRRLCYNNKSDFINASFFKPGRKKKKINFAFTHSWENSIGMLGDAYHQTFNEQ